MQLGVTVLRHLDVIATGEQAYPPDVAVFDIVDERLQRVFGIEFCKGHDY